MKNKERKMEEQRINQLEKDIQIENNQN